MNSSFSSDLIESWCELQFKSGCSSTGSISHLNHTVNPEVLEKLLQEAQKELSPIPKSESPLSLFFQDISPSSSIKQVDQAEPAHEMMNSRVVKTTIINCTNKNLVNLNSSNSIKPILKSNISVYEDSYDEEDADLEYLGDESCGNNFKHLNTDRSNALGAPGPAVSTPCQNCINHKKQIELLIEKHIDNQKELIKIKNEFEVKLLNKSLEISCSSSTPTGAPASPSRVDKSISTSPILSSSKSGTNTPKYPINTDNNDWIKYFSSRPQAQPPKEWNFVHPNSAKSKVDKKENFFINDSFVKSSDQSNCIVNSFKLLSKENIGKLIFTHMASFIVGATLMLLVLKKHLNVKNSLYFI
ncbi:BCL2 adenovirus E1B 19 kDa -interacting 3 [Brachionus plicatilis]|uniref:BCL2 adenovirus E1B 19 kDa-interacting 3 n=1 Tax=Brachionus plicatilis TaxID=10195 RepID=A0A3M7S2K7_BRAPC|nr:BCL2 adenovirus E1B 19 kDa -interacting 3 [Brachionus plicatilis]